jgi:spoIIIJ-associated protein
MNEKITHIAKELVEKIGVINADISVESEGGSYFISIKTEDERSLVGREKDHFEAFSHLLKRLLSKVLGEEAKVKIDVNDTLKRMEEVLIMKAKMTAERARTFKRDVEMDPMTSYERRLVHSALENMPNIKTESYGEGRGRRLIVRFVENKENI